MELQTFAIAMFLAAQNWGATRIEGFKAMEAGVAAALADARQRGLRVRTEASLPLNVSYVLAAANTSKILKWHKKEKIWTFAESTPRVRLIRLCHIIREPEVRDQMEFVAVSFLTAVCDHVGSQSSFQG